MPVDFGFASDPSYGHYFISYNSEDGERVAKTVRILHQWNIPVWYDQGLQYSKEKWETQIANNIRISSAMIVFVTRGIFQKMEPYVKTEYYIAKRHGIRLIPVLLDNISDKEIPPEHDAWWQDMLSRQCVVYKDTYSPENTAQKIKGAINAASEGSNFEAQRGVVDYFRKRDTVSRGVISALLIALVFAFGIMLYMVGLNRGMSGENSREYEAGTVAGYASDDTDDVPVQDVEDDPVETYKSEYYVGQVFTMGTYEQDIDTSNGSEPIEWRVLEVDGNRALVITDKCIDVVQYNDEYEVNNWENCSLRRWMNNTFYSNAFMPDEKNKIIETQISNPNNPEYGTVCGNDTYDRIFSLSIQEAEKYFNNSTRAANPTVRVSKMKSVVTQANDIQVENGCCWWNLRSLGQHRKTAACVTPAGEIYYKGRSIDSDFVPVRPAMYISLDG